MERFHYLPTESRTFCGQLIGARTTGSGDWEAFLQVYQSGEERHCHHCVRKLRRWARFAPAIVAADRVRARALGLE